MALVTLEPVAVGRRSSKIPQEDRDIWSAAMALATLERLSLAYWFPVWIYDDVLDSMSMCWKRTGVLWRNHGNTCTKRSLLVAIFRVLRRLAWNILREERMSWCLLYHGVEVYRHDLEQEKEGVTYSKWAVMISNDKINENRSCTQ